MDIIFFVLHGHNSEQLYLSMKETHINPTVQQQKTDHPYPIAMLQISQALVYNNIFVVFNFWLVDDILLLFSSVR